MRYIDTVTYPRVDIHVTISADAYYAVPEWRRNQIPIAMEEYLERMLPYVHVEQFGYVVPVGELIPPEYKRMVHISVQDIISSKDIAAAVKYAVKRLNERR